jgi:hypothetical protein
MLRIWKRSSWTVPPSFCLSTYAAGVAHRTHLSADDVLEVRWASDFRPRAALADRFRDGLVFLASDAATSPLPEAGRD